MLYSSVNSFSYSHKVLVFDLLQAIIGLLSQAMDLYVLDKDKGHAHEKYL